jgi:hypothetical protein
VIAAVPFVIAGTGQLLANLLPVTLAVILAALALAAAKRHTLADVIRPMRHAAAMPVIHFWRVIRHVSRQWHTVGQQSQTALRRVYVWLRQGIPDGQARLHIPGGETWRWQLAGVFWLATAVSILTAFIIAA